MYPPGSGRADHRPRRRAEVQVHIRQCRRSRGPDSRHLHAEHDPGAALPEPAGIFLDRRLKASERRHVRVRADLGRDADVLAVSSGHPACASGVSRAAARGIAAGTIRTWSAAGVPTPASGDAIALRRAGSGVDRFVEPRFRAGIKLPQGARAAYNGGLSEAASGNLAIAAVTSWSRARAFQVTTCAVPVGGAAPSDASVRALSHPDAYPISFVTLRRLRQVARSSPPSCSTSRARAPRRPSASGGCSSSRKRGPARSARRTVSREITRDHPRYCAGDVAGQRRGRASRDGSVERTRHGCHA